MRDCSVFQDSTSDMDFLDRGPLGPSTLGSTSEQLHEAYHFWDGYYESRQAAIMTEPRHASDVAAHSESSCQAS